jgi:hypothetical protein
MNTRKRVFLHARLYGLLLACLPAQFPGQAAAQADSLKHDPFARPASVARPARTTGATGQAVTGQAVTVQATAAAPVWKPELRAIMVAGPNSIVNVEGTLVSLGEQMQGYRLAEVHEESAVFVNGSTRVRLVLRGESKMGDKK